MKNKRHQKILELIEQYHIDTQEELLKRLCDSGYPVTQATVSRDIRELQLVKVQRPDGYQYAVNAARDSADMAFKFHAVFAEAVYAVDYAENIVVVKCYTGMANAACAAMDAMRWEGVVGTIAGDDTIFCLMRTKTAAEDLTKQLENLIK